MSESKSNEMANGSGAMFDRIAKRYDLLNRLMSFGVDRQWRRLLLNSMPKSGRVLDVATGTADVAVALAKRSGEISVVGLDPSAAMLECGREKIERLGLQNRIELIQGDAQDMPFPDDHFSAISIAFGIRNIPDRLKGLREMARVTEEGGTIAILELSEAADGPFAFLSRFHVHHVVPFMGKLISGRDEYRYLQSSIQAFPSANEFCNIMTQAGLDDIKVKRLTLGNAHLYLGRKAKLNK
jgi:demethylmenaquinone methyltransferase/2-methoxy-6-polyprenyl-1,4-benzoquinol methylase